MNIQRITTIEEALAIIPWEYEIQQKGRIHCPIQKLLLLIREYIDDPLFTILFAHDKGEPYGFCIAFISKLPGNKAIHILRMYGPGIVDVFLDELVRWGKGFGMTEIGFTIEKNMKAIERKYGFKQDSVNMKRGKDDIPLH